ncbi:MAG TPA: hypothetical protein EYQ78_08610 [Candidatus Poseidoniales archaeon]|nr:hypothetical protein [Candidatus Poseidoniales archaeon]
MRCIQMSKSILITTLLLLVTAVPFVPTVAADQAAPNDLQAQNIEAIFDPFMESTTIMWENVGTQNLTIAQMLQTSRYLIYRSATQMNTSQIQNNTIPYIANVSACTGNVISCPSQQHSVSHPLPPGVNGTFFYGIATQLDDGSLKAFMEFGSAQIPEPIPENTHDIIAPFAVNATFFPDTSRTKIDWINLNQLQPGTLLENGPNAYISNIYRHLNPASRANWFGMQKTLVASEPAGISSTSYDVPLGTDVEAYYSVTYSYLGYEDFRFIGGVNTMNAEFPVAEDNVAPIDVQGVTASFIAESLGGTGNTTITWADLLEELDGTYHVWRSGAPFNDTQDPNIEHIAAVPSGVATYRYEVERGTLGYAYYAVTSADARGNHNSTILPSSVAGPIMENAFDPWVAEPTNVQATYIGGGWTNVTWTDQVGAEGESYHIWHSWTKLSAASNLTLEATLAATVPDGVQYALIPVPIDKDRLSYYCITSVTRYNHLNATYEDTGFFQNCIPLSVREDTLPPAPVQLAQPMLQGSQNSVLLSWINSLAEVDETYSIWRHLGTPFENNETGNLSDDEGWELMIDNYLPLPSETTILRELSLEENLDRHAWYALIVADSWGNSRDSVSNRSNTWLVHEDTTPPEVEILLGIGGEEGAPSGPLKSGDYRLHIHSGEPLDEFPIIQVQTENYIEGSAIGTTFTPEGEVTRATPFLASDTHFIWDFPIPSGMETSNVTITTTLVDIVGNSQTFSLTNWSVDSKAPTIELFSPSSESKYLYGTEIRIHGVVTDDVELVEVKYQFTNVGEFFDEEFEWENVTEITPPGTPSNTLVFSMTEPASTFEDPGNHRLKIMAKDSAGNEKLFTTTFYVDHCYENISGITLCQSGNSPFNEGEQEPEAPLSLTSPPYIIIIAVGAFNLLLLFFAIMMGILAAQDPSKKKKGGDEFDEEDDWMMEFMSGGDDGGSGDTADAGLAELEAAPKTKQLEDEGDPFDTAIKGEQKKRRKKTVVEDDDDFDDDDFGDDDDDEWGDEDEDDAPKKRKPKKRRPSPKRKAKRRVVKRKN